VIVADTNLVIYFAIRGERVESAERVRQRDADWVAPPLWASEFRNVLATHARVGRLTAHQAREVWGVGRALVDDLEVDPLAVLDAAFAHGLSAYDAEFVALAESLGIPLVTDDRRVLAACPNRAASLDDFGFGAAEALPDDPGR
jgi:predicted nucleic acid-binding protein